LFCCPVSCSAVAPGLIGASGSSLTALCSGVFLNSSLVCFAFLAVLVALSRPVGALLACLSQFLAQIKCDRVLFCDRVLRLGREQSQILRESYLTSPKTFQLCRGHSAGSAHRSPYLLFWIETSRLCATFKQMRILKYELWAPLGPKYWKISRFSSLFDKIQAVVTTKSPNVPLGLTRI